MMLLQILCTCASSFVPDESPVWCPVLLWVGSRVRLQGSDGNAGNLFLDMVVVFSCAQGND